MNGSYEPENVQVRARLPIPSFASFGLSKRLDKVKGSLESSDLGASSVELKTPVASYSRSTERPLRRRRSHSKPQHARQGPYVPDLEFSNASARRKGPNEGAFIVDRRGNPSNAIYPAFDRCMLPSYIRFGSGAVVGLESSYKVDEGASDELHTIVPRTDVSTDCGSRLCNIDLWRLGQAEKYMQIPGYDDSTETAGCLPTIHSAMNVRRKKTTAPAGCLHEPKPVDIVSIHENSSGSNHITGVTDGKFDANIPVSSLGRMINVDPQDSTSWTEASEHQNAPVKDKSPADALQGDCGLRIDLPKTAANQGIEPESREIILLEMMDTVAQALDTDASIKQWRKVLHENPGYPRLWIMYLDYRQSLFTTFRYEDILQVYRDCLTDLDFTSTQCSRTSPERNKVYEIRILLLLRVTLLMRESGYSEQALALWQALFEIEFFRPKSLQDLRQESSSCFSHYISAAFESFWDSAKPRIGESGAKGWNESCSIEESISSADVTETYPVANEDISTLPWILRERWCLLRLWQPAHPLDDTAELDPHRVVLYSDIQPFLAFSTSQTDRHVLLEAFLAFCQLPSYKAHSLTRMWSKEGLVCSSDSYFDADTFSASPHSSVSQTGNLHENDWSVCFSRGLPLQSWISNFQIDTTTLFADPASWFSAVALWRKLNDDEFCALANKSFILRLLKSLAASDLLNDEFLEYVVALETSICPRRAQATVKHFLSRRTSSLRLYNAYAIVEYRLGHSQKAENTLSTSIHMASSLHHESRRDTILLWHTWTWELLRAGKTQTAMLRLLCYGGPMIHNRQAVLPEQTSEINASILRVKTRLLAFRNEMIGAQSFRHVVLAMECLILLAYIIDDTTLIKAAETFGHNLRVLQRECATDDRTHELLRQAFAHLLYYHEIKTPFKSHGVRPLLADSIRAFPSNHIFWSLKAWMDSRYGSIDRLRAIADRHINFIDSGHRLTDDICLHVTNINIELWGVYGSNVNSIRSTFKYAVESKNGAHCAFLWKMFYLFECANRATNKAKAILRLGIKACPWAKALYLLAFEHPLAGLDGWSEADLRGLYNVMIEKGLRICTLMDT